MDQNQLRDLLSAVQNGQTNIDQAFEQLRKLPFESLGYANIDHHRAARCGSTEVVFCPGKTVQQVLGIVSRLAASGQRVLATRASEPQLDALGQQFPDAILNPTARAAIINETALPVSEPNGDGAPFVAVLSAGTADTPVADEAAFTLRYMQVPTKRIMDVGVSGLHRLLAHIEPVQQACAVIVVAGMEGALPSVVGGLVGSPVFAVPTSIGYGASFGGLAAMLGMLNSCASNVSVVNIDNGFGAAYCAGKVYQQVMKARAGVVTEGAKL
jgi:pyridinium-3,5-biscarboxylic acid mononucleotide synthase